MLLEWMSEIQAKEKADGDDIEVTVSCNYLPCLDAVLSCKYSKKILNLKKGKIVSIIVIATAVVPLRHNLGQLQDMRY